MLTANGPSLHTSLIVVRRDNGMSPRQRLCHVCAVTFVGGFKDHALAAGHRQQRTGVRDEKRDSRVAALIVGSDLGYREIGELVGLSRDSVSHIAVERGVQRRRNKRARERKARKARMIAAYRDGTLLKEIAKAEGVSRDTVTRTLKLARMKGEL